MNFCVLKISDNEVLLENERGEKSAVLRECLPKVCENDILTLTDGGYQFNSDETKARRKRITDLQNSLFE